jgi:hypothetical protein
MAKFVHLEEADKYLNLDFVSLVSVTKKEGSTVTEVAVSIEGFKEDEIVRGRDANDLATHLWNLGR